MRYNFRLHNGYTLLNSHFTCLMAASYQLDMLSFRCLRRDQLLYDNGEVIALNE